ncbi:unnamed protein product [Arabidopsis thaliana]|uniref:(thale cress) hypothetical protein n=1 Tax=Arabidopsis thaliana TaxID=3702 RepID=A0A7G2DXF4_ARATH|nr:unnamed protein product [Arabidopsis thaliana]
MLSLPLFSLSVSVKCESVFLYVLFGQRAKTGKRDLENKANDLGKIQKDIGKNHQLRKKYTIQLGENELVLKELDLLEEDANVYKLIGPVLVKQDLAEANANVRKRIEYISAELKRLDAILQDMEEKQNNKRETIMKLQQRLQTIQAGKAKA